MSHEPTHPATRRRMELLDEGFRIIDKDVSIDAMKKNIRAKGYQVGAVWITTGEVLAKTKGQTDAE